MCLLNYFSRVQLFATLWTVTHQAPLSMGFSRQGYWNGLLCPSPGDLPDPGTESTSPVSPALAGWFFTTSATWEGYHCNLLQKIRYLWFYNKRIKPLVNISNYSYKVTFKERMWLTCIFFPPQLDDVILLNFLLKTKCGISNG